MSSQPESSDKKNWGGPLRQSSQTVLGARAPGKLVEPRQVPAQQAPIQWVWRAPENLYF